MDVLDRLPTEREIREQIARNTRENLLLESLLDSVQVAQAQREARERAAGCGPFNQGAAP